jgi:hypothetical protein
MASNINPNNIDGAYPVAGQDNDSQGFRDNFTNIKTNFVYTAAEINDLQSKAVLKAALTGGSLNNDMGGAVISDVTLVDWATVREALGTVSGSQTLDYSQAGLYTLTTSGSVTFALSNFPPSGSSGELLLEVTVSNTAHTLTFPSAVGAGSAATGAAYVAGFNNSTKVLTLSATGTYRYALSSNDGGATVFIRDLTQPLIGSYGDANVVTLLGSFGSNAISTTGNVTTGNVTASRTVVFSGAEDLTASAAANLTLATSYFTTAAAETATLADGVAGQIKVFAAANVSAGDMVITVANAAWGGSGTLTFGDDGDACTLQYINGKWYVIGNNGVVLA